MCVHLRSSLCRVTADRFSPTHSPQLIKKIQPAQPVKPKKAKRQKVTRPAGEAAGSDASDSSSSADELETSEAESLLAEDPTYRPAPRAPQPKRYTPFIDTLFGGKLASVIVCEECRGVSRIEEDFLDISLPLKSDDAKLKRVSQNAPRLNLFPY